MLFFYPILIVLIALEPFLPGQLSCIIAMLLYLTFFFRLYKSEPAAATVLFTIFFAKLLLLISLFFIAGGNNIRELGRFATDSMHAFYFCLLACGFLHISAKSFGALNKAFPIRTVTPPTNLSTVYVFITIAAASATVLYLLYIGLRSGFAVSSGTDRFAYRDAQGWLFIVISTGRPLVAAAMGMARFRLTHLRAERMILDVLFFSILAISFLFGEKFMSLIVFTYFYVLPFLVGDASARMPRIPPSVWAIGSVLLVGCAAATWMFYSGYGTLGATETLNRLLGRFTGQGQLWYIVTAENNSIFDFDAHQFSKLLQTLAAGKANSYAFYEKVGIFHLIARYAPENIWSSIVAARGSVQFTGSYEAYFLSISGHFGAITATIFAAFITTACIYYIINALRSGHVLSFLVASFLMLNLYTMLNQGSLWIFLGLKALVYFAVLISAELALRVFLSGVMPGKEAISFKTSRR